MIKIGAGRMGGIQDGEMLVELGEAKEAGFRTLDRRSVVGFLGGFLKAPQGGSGDAAVCLLCCQGTTMSDTKWKDCFNLSLASLQ